MNIGPTIRCEYKKHGRLQHLDMPRDSVSLSPSDRTFFRRSNIEKNQLATVLHIALDSVLISQAAAALKKALRFTLFQAFSVALAPPNRLAGLGVGKKFRQLRLLPYRLPSGL
jgi:hypothetical protein